MKKLLSVLLAAAVVMDIKERAIKAATGAAMGTGTTMEYEVVGGNYSRLINRHLAELFLKNLKKVGGIELSASERKYAEEMLANSGVTDTSVLDAMENVVPMIEPPMQTGESSDVGNVSQVVPLATLRYATTIPVGGLHSWQLASMGGTTIGTKALMNVARVFYLSAVDLYSSPELLKEVKAEFSASRGAHFHFTPLVGDRQPPLDYLKKQ